MTQLLYIALIAALLVLAWLIVALAQVEKRIDRLERAQIDLVERALKDGEEIAKQIADQVIRRALQ